MRLVPAAVIPSATRSGKINYRRAGRLPHTGRVIHETNAPEPLPVAAHRAIQRVLSGTKRDADSAGRLLMAIPANGASAALQEVETVLMTADPKLWIALEGARDWLCWDNPGTRLQQPPAGSDTAPALCVKALFADGRTREHAVRLLAESGSLAALPVLGLRAADWVPQVREAARDAIRCRLSDDVDGAALTTIAPMALHLAQRSHGRWLVEQITDQLAGPSYERVANRLLNSPNLGLRRAAYQALSNTEALGLERAVHGALHDRDIVIRGRCAEYAARVAVDAASAPLMRRLLGSTTPLVRAVALGALDKLGERDTIEAMLADRSALVRGTARFYLKPHGVDFARIYRQLLGSGPDTVTPGAVAGLAEVGAAEDTDVFVPLLRHPRVKIRVEAIRALQATASSINTDAMLALIEENRSPGVTRQATTTLLARGAGVDADRLLALLDRERPVPVRLAAWQLLASRDSAWRLAVNVMLLSDPEDAVATRASSDLQVALQQQIYNKPTGTTAELLAAHLPDADRLLPVATARLLRFILGMPLPAEPPTGTESGRVATAVASVSQATSVKEPGQVRWWRRR